MWRYVFIFLAAVILKGLDAQFNQYARGQANLGAVPTRSVANSNGTSKKVHLEVFYETNCPDSMRFITKQLYPVYQEMKDVVDINLVPFGKAQETYDSVSKKYVFKCQHGPAECYGNTVQSCAISLYPKLEDHLNFVKCMESYPRPSDSGNKESFRITNFF